MSSTTLTRRAVLAGAASACLVTVLPAPDVHALARDDYYERFYRAWDRLSLQQQEEALLKLEAMFPAA